MIEQHPQPQNLELLNQQYPVTEVVPEELRQHILVHPGETRWHEVIGELGKFESETLLGLLAEEAVLAGKWVPMTLDGNAFSIGKETDLFEAYTASTTSLIPKMNALVTPNGYMNGAIKLESDGYARIPSGYKNPTLEITGKGILELKKQLALQLKRYGLPRTADTGPSEWSEMMRKELPQMLAEAKTLVDQEHPLHDSIIEEINKPANQAGFGRMVAALVSGSGVGKVEAMYLAKETFPDREDAFYDELLLIAEVQAKEPARRQKLAELHMEAKTSTHLFEQAEQRYQELRRGRTFTSFFDREFNQKLRTLSELYQKFLLSRQSVSNLALHDPSQNHLFIVPSQLEKLTEDLENTNTFIRKVNQAYHQHFTE